MLDRNVLGVVRTALARVLGRPQARPAALPAVPRGKASAGAPDVVAPGARMTRVLHVFSYFRPDFTGEGLYLEKLARHLHAIGIASDVAVARTRAAARFDPLGPIRRVRFFGNGLAQIRQLHPAMVVWFIANARRYDVVHFHGAIDRLFLLHLLAACFGCRIVHSCTLDDGLARLVGGYRPAFRPAVRRLCRLIDAVVAISPSLYQDSLQVLPASRVTLIPQGADVPPIDAASRAAARARWDFAEHDVVLLFVGSLCPRKDPMFLIDNQPSLTAPPGRVRLVLVGPDLDPGYAEAARRRVAASSRRDDILLLGYMDDPSPIYRAADVFVFASRLEGFGNVLLEAMAFGLPVVSRRLAGVTDAFIAHGRTGFLFEQAAEYCAAVQTMAEQPALRRRLGAAAREAAVANHAIAAIAARYAALYRGLLTNGGGE